MRALIRSALATLLVSISLSWATPGTTQAGEAPPPGFVSRLLLLRDSDVTKLLAGTHVPLVNLTHMNRHETVDFITVVMFPTPDAKGHVTLSCEATFTNPQGKIILTKVDPACFNATPPEGAAGPFHIDRAIMFTSEATDPSGLYTARMKTTDINSGQTATAVVSFTLDP